MPVIDRRPSPDGVDVMPAPRERKIGTGRDSDLVMVIEKVGVDHDVMDVAPVADINDLSGDACEPVVMPALPVECKEGSCSKLMDMGLHFTGYLPVLPIPVPDPVHDKTPSKHNYPRYYTGAGSIWCIGKRILSTD
jgi:hypothetical protein